MAEFNWLFFHVVQYGKDIWYIKTKTQSYFLLTFYKQIFKIPASQTSNSNEFLNIDVALEKNWSIYVADPINVSMF